MAVTDSCAIVPKMPNLGHLDALKIAGAYDSLTDTLTASSTGEPKVAISIYADDATHRVDSVTEEVVGLQIEEFLARLLQRTRGPAETT